VFVAGHRISLYVFPYITLSPCCSVLKKQKPHPRSARDRFSLEAKSLRAALHLLATAVYRATVQCCSALGFAHLRLHPGLPDSWVVRISVYGCPVAGGEPGWIKAPAPRFPRRWLFLWRSHLLRCLAALTNFRVTGAATSGPPRPKKKAAYWLPMRRPTCCFVTLIARSCRRSSTNSKR
jgi:hypothetical protein